MVDVHEVSPVSYLEDNQPKSVDIRLRCGYRFAMLRHQEFRRHEVKRAAYSLRTA